MEGGRMFVKYREESPEAFRYYRGINRTEIRNWILRILKVRSNY